MWPTTSTYGEVRCSPLCYRFGSLPSSARAARPGEQAALQSAVFERQGRLIPRRETGPPRIERASTPILPAEYGGGPPSRRMAGQMGAAEKCGTRAKEGTSGGVLESPATSGFGARSREGDHRRMKPGMGRRVEPRRGGAATRNGARSGRGSGCMEAANEAKDGPDPKKQQQGTCAEMGGEWTRRSPVGGRGAAWSFREEKGR